MIDRGENDEIREALKDEAKAIRRHEQAKKDGTLELESLDNTCKVKQLTITTRPATRDDLDTILTFRKRLQRHLTDSNPRIWRRNTESDALRDEALDETTGPRKWTIIAEENHSPIGYISGGAITRPDEEPPTIDVITTMWVEPAHRDRGAGTRLVRDLLQRLVDAGVEDVTLRYVAGNSEAEQFWAGLGFQPTITVANAEPRTIMKAMDGKRRDGGQTRQPPSGNPGKGPDQ